MQTAIIAILVLVVIWLLILGGFLFRAYAARVTTSEEKAELYSKPWVYFTVSTLLWPYGGSRAVLAALWGAK